MIGHRAPMLGLLCLLLPSPVAATEDAAAPPQARLIVLRNGEILRGSPVKQNDRYLIAIDGGEIRLHVREVDFVCDSLDEAYQLQRRRLIAGRIEDHLNLAEWSLRHNLYGYAAQQISAAMQLDSRHPRLARLEQRLREGLQQASAPSSNEATERSSSSARPLSPDDLDRFARALPADTIEQFTTKIQPMLSNYCATAGCHGAAATSRYALLRPPVRKTIPRHLTLRNLHSTLERVNFNQPDKSALLTAARAPHGSCGAAVLGEDQARQYEELRAWVTAAVGRAAVASSIAAGPQTVSSGATLHPANVDASGRGVAVPAK